MLKAEHSAFLGTPLDILLDRLGIRELVIASIVVGMCIAAPTQDARMREFNIWVPANFVAASSAPRKRSALHWIETL